MKNLLLIAPIFYSYESEIIKEITKKDRKVTFMSLYPSIFLLKLFLIIISKLLSKNNKMKIYNLYFKIKFKVILKNKKFNEILIINGETLSEKMVQNLKSKYLATKGKIILYIWTPIERYKSILKIYKLFSDVYSFEKKDCDNYNFKFLPNFFSSLTYEFVGNNSLEYDLYFVGQYRRERYNLKRKLESIKNKNIKVILYHNFFTYILFKFLKYKEYKNISIKDLVFRPIDRRKMYYDMSKSKCILDDADINQEGLTQRVFDSLILEKKLITTNSAIKGYDFYNAKNIVIVDREKIQIPDFIFEEKYEKVNNDIILEYSISKWVEILLGE